VSHDPSEIILMCCFAAQETFPIKLSMLKTDVQLKGVVPLKKKNK